MTSYLGIGQFYAKHILLLYFVTEKLTVENRHYFIKRPVDQFSYFMPTPFWIKFTSVHCDDSVD